MTESEPIKPTVGTWARLPVNDNEYISPKVTFEINIPQTVKFLADDPDEREGDNGAYYTFLVNHSGQDTVIQTSAWTLLAQLKKHWPLAGKMLKITKKMEKGRQFFLVEKI